MRRPLLIATAALALALLVTVLVIMLSADWYLQCTGSDGAPLGGIDCLDSTPRTDSSPAHAFGFWPLAATGFVALLALVGCAVAEFVRRRRRDRRPPRSSHR
jgi:hypothetical protein